MVSEDRIAAHLRYLTEDIGVRLAGSGADARAIAYVRGQFEEAGAQVCVETFPCFERAVTREHLDVRLGGEWQSFPCSLFSSTPGTGGRVVEAPVCFFESAAEYRRPDLSHLRGKAVVHLGCHIESRENYRRLVEAHPAFLMFVDVRYPGVTPLADGMFPAYTRALGAVPTVNVAYADAWRWKAEGAASARLLVDGGMRDGRSGNVIAELPGEDPDAGLLLLGAHHDTQADSVGADDNGSGVVALLELARVLSPRPRRRSIRLVSFGAEEQLSVGSADYVRRRREALRPHVRFVLNFDSFGSHLGWTRLSCSGPASMANHVAGFFDRAGLFTQPVREVVPYTDLFPFVAAGIPGVYLGRNNCTAGRFFHHRPDDDMTRVSIPLIADLTGCAADLITALASSKALPFPARIPHDQAPQARMFWEDLYGGWEGTEGGPESA